jgi:putative ABC transport system permease protein
MSAAAGARRTNSVVDRGRRAQRAFDIFMVPAYTTNGERLDFDKIAAFPEVVEALNTPVAGLKGVSAGQEFESAVGVVFSGHNSRVVSGRMPRRRDEVAVNVLARDAWGLEPGRRIRAQFAPVEEGADPSRDVKASLRVTGVFSSIGDFGGDAEPTIFLTQSFWAAHKDAIGSVDLFMLRLRHGPADYATFHSHVDALVGGAPVFYLESRALDDQIRRSFRLQGSALSILAAFLGVVALFIGSQLLIRVIRFEAGDDATLRALGVGTGSLAGVAIGRALLIAMGATTTAVALAFGSSRLFPLGDPGLAEPFPGPRADAAVFTGGALVVIAVLVLVSLASLRGSGRARGGPPRPSPLAALMARTLPGPASAVGARLALERGSARTTVPVRSTFATAVLGVAALVIALSVGASLTRLLSTPRLFGWDWDVVVSGSEQRDIDAAKVAHVPGVDAFSTGVTGQGGSALVNGHEVAATALEQDGGVTPPVLEGRVPVRDNEVALAARTLRQLSTHVGGTVRMSFPGLGGRSATFRVVGVVVLPFTGDNTSLGEGLFVTMDGARRMFAEIPADSAFVRFSPTANPRTVIAALRRAFPEAEVEGPRTPMTLLDFGNVRNFPLLIAGVIGLLAAGTVLHLLSTSIRAARRDLAIVKAVGASHGQLRGIVAWQSSIVMGIALLIGAPLGLIAGRWLWILVARNYGFVAAPAVPLVAIAAVTAGGLLFANLVALLPARTAARTPVALVLRTE